MKDVALTIIVLLANFAFLVSWVVGWVLAQGFWSTTAAVLFFPWGWYLIAERVLLAWGIA